MGKDFKEEIEPETKSFNKEKKLTKQRVFYDGMNCAIKTIYKEGTLESEIKPEHKNLIGEGEFN